MLERPHWKLLWLIRNEPHKPNEVRLKDKTLFFLFALCQQSRLSPDHENNGHNIFFMGHRSYYDYYSKTANATNIKNSCFAIV